MFTLSSLFSDVSSYTENKSVITVYRVIRVTNKRMFVNSDYFKNNKEAGLLQKIIQHLSGMVTIPVFWANSTHFQSSTSSVQF